MITREKSISPGNYGASVKLFIPLGDKSIAFQIYWKELRLLWLFQGELWQLLKLSTLLMKVITNKCLGDELMLILKISWNCFFFTSAQSSLIQFMKIARSVFLIILARILPYETLWKLDFPFFRLSHESIIRRYCEKFPSNDWRRGAFGCGVSLRNTILFPFNQIYTKRKKL